MYPRPTLILVVYINIIILRTHTHNTHPRIYISYHVLVPPEIEHTLIWTKAPIYHPELVHPSIKARVDQDGLWGFTGLDSPPPSPSLLPTFLPALAEWGITKDNMITSAPPSPEEAELLRCAASEVHRYVQNRWKEDEWETAWFVNPPVSNSIAPHDTLR